MKEQASKENTTFGRSHGSLNEEQNKPNSGEKAKLEYTRTALESTPFIIHHSESHGWAAGIAEHKLTGWYASEKELLTVLKGVKKGGQIDWNLITGVVLILIAKEREYNVLKEKQLENLNKPENED